MQVPDLMPQCFHDPERLKKAQADPLLYHGAPIAFAHPRVTAADKPRLATALQLLEATETIARRLAEVSSPFLVVHGNAGTTLHPNPAAVNASQTP